MKESVIQPTIFESNRAHAEEEKRQVALLAQLQSALSEDEPMPRIYTMSRNPRCPSPTLLNAAAGLARVREVRDPPYRYYDANERQQHMDRGQQDSAAIRRLFEARSHSPERSPSPPRNAEVGVQPTKLWPPPLLRS